MRSIYRVLFYLRRPWTHRWI